MLALTVRQPYASLIVLGVKPVENRSWATRHRGEIAIHAAKEIFQDDVDYCEDRLGYKLDLDELVYGAVIGSVQLSGIKEHHRSKWYAPGNVAWCLGRPRAIKPVPCPGSQRLWTLPPAVEALVLSRL